MAELADAPDLGSGGQPRAGSSPVIRIRRALIIGVLFLLHCIWCCSVRTRWERDLLKKIGVFALGIALVWMITPVLSLASDKDTEKSTETVIDDVYSEDDRLKLIHHETYAYDKTSATIEDGIYKQYMWVIKNYDKEEIEKSSHAYFDEQNRLLYALGYSANIVKKIFTSGTIQSIHADIFITNPTVHLIEMAIILHIAICLKLVIFSLMNRTGFSYICPIAEMLARTPMATVKNSFLVKDIRQNMTKNG